MKAYISLFALLFCVTISSTAQRMISFSDFDKVNIKGNLEVVLTPGAETGVIIDRGESDNVNIEMKGDLLVVKHKELFRYKSYREFPVKVEVIYKEIDEITVIAGAKVKAIQSITGDRVDIKLRSGAKANLDIQAEKSDISVAEGAIATMTGRVRQLSCNAATGGQLEAQGLMSDRCKIRANTGGTARISAKDYLDAAAHTGGSIFYSGSPEELVAEDNLGGTISRG